MIKVFGKTDTDFSSNGDIVIKPLRAVVHKEGGYGDYSLSLETGLEYVDFLAEGNIVVANTPQGDQPFRVRNVTKTKNKITTKCRHVFYDSENHLIPDCYVVQKNCNDAMGYLNGHTVTASPFTVSSDVGTVNSYRCVRKSLYEALEEVLERWGGYLVRDGFDIQIKTQIGQDNGVTVRYRKNIRDITCEENWDDVVTQLLPVGKDGILLNAVNPDDSLFVVGEVAYSLPYTKTVSFTQDDIVREEFETELAYKTALVDDLRRQALNYVNENSVPKVNYTLKANIDTITDIGDVVEVIDERLGVNIMTNVISYDWDCVLGKYIETEFGNYKKKLSGLIKEIAGTTQKYVAEQTDAVKVSLSSELKEARDYILGMMDNSYVIYDGDKILVVDALPKENAQNVMIINSGGIGFSQNGIHGQFNSAWTLDGTLDMQHINVVNLIADMISGGTLKLGAKSNQSGVLEVYDEVNNLIGRLDKNGLKMYGVDGSYVLINNDVGFAGYDRNDNKIYWVSGEEFHMKKSVVEEEITLCNSVRFIPITITSGGVVVNDGIGLVSAGGE